MFCVFQNEMIITVISSTFSNERQDTCRSWNYATFVLKQPPSLPCLQENETEVSTRRSAMEKEAYLPDTLTYLVTSTLGAYRQQMTQKPYTFWQARLCPKIYEERQMWVWSLALSPTTPFIPAPRYHYPPSHPHSLASWVTLATLCSHFIICKQGSWLYRVAI